MLKAQLFYWNSQSLSSIMQMYHRFNAKHRLQNHMRRLAISKAFWAFHILCHFLRKTPLVLLHAHYIEDFCSRRSIAKLLEKNKSKLKEQIDINHLKGKVIAFKNLFTFPVTVSISAMFLGKRIFSYSLTFALNVLSSTTDRKSVIGLDDLMSGWERSSFKKDSKYAFLRWMSFSLNDVFFGRGGMEIVGNIFTIRFRNHKKS